jgi:hypothetical protein
MIIPLGAQLVVFEAQGVHAHDVDDTLELGLFAERDLNGDGRRVETLFDGAERAIEVGADLVHFVDEAHARDLVAVRLAPHGLGLGLHALLAVEHGDGAIEHAQ